MQFVTRFVAFEFAGGDAFFWGLAVLMTATLIAARRDGPRIRSGFRLATIGSVIVIAASATPLPLWFYGAGLALTLIAFSARFGRPGAERVDSATPKTDGLLTEQRFRIVASLLVAWCAVAAAWEFSYRLPPRLGATPRYDTLVVIGDSVSAGLRGPRERTWPRQFRERYFGSTLDLAAEGATAHSALKQAHLANQRLANRDEIVLIEIGGNDYFEMVPPLEFEQQLDRLLSDLERPNRQVILLELPLPPFYNAYGRVQREVAARHDVALISKREFAKVLFTSNATLDSVHLSDAGHSQFADMVWRHVGPILRTPQITSMTLYSLAPEGGDGFHGYTVLGKVDVTSPTERTAIFAAVQQDLDEGYKHGAFGCFEPRHGVRIVRGGKTYDYVLCFHCLNANEFVDDRFVSDQTMSGSSRPIIDAHLKAAGIPLAKD
jgi:acyl-CoA thioesterase I